MFHFPWLPQIHLLKLACSNQHPNQSHALHLAYMSFSPFDLQKKKK